MKITTHLTAALFATVIFTSSAFAGPSRTDYFTAQQTLSKQTTTKVASRRSKHYTTTIATYTTQPVKPAAVEVPQIHNIANGSF